MFDLLPSEEELYKLAEASSGKYQGAQPFPHAYFDGVFNPKILDNVLSEFPKVGEDKWIKFAGPHQKKLGSTGESMFGPQTRFVLHYLNSLPFLKFLEKLTGIENLIPDPHYLGGGLHQIVPGGMLKIHADFNKHNYYDLDRRLNVLIFLNHDWRDEYGGHFELWSKDMKRSEVKILPIFNRMAMFSTTSDSWHGHPEPLKCPNGMTRKSLALYYYSNGRPAHEVQAKHSTLFRPRDESENRSFREAKRRSIKSGLKQWIPPIIWSTTKKFKNKAPEERMFLELIDIDRSLQARDVYPAAGACSLCESVSGSPGPCEKSSPRNDRAPRRIIDSK